MANVHIDRAKVIAVLQGPQGRRFLTSIGRRLVASIKSFFPRGKRSGGRSSATRHAADTIRADPPTPIADGLQMSVHTTDVDYATIIESGSAPHTIKGNPFLTFFKESGEKRTRPRVRHPGTKAQRPFERGAKALGLKFRRK